MNEKIEVELLDKHRNFIKYYKSNDTYWGIGIENEVYLEMSLPLNINPKVFYTKNAKRERYSVNYMTSYKPGIYEYCIDKMILPNTVPLLVNANSFTKTDRFNQPITTYSKNPIPNPKFDGLTLYQFLCKCDNYFEKEYMSSFIFDGDTIEFISQKFYKVTIDDAIHELVESKFYFITKLRKIFKEHNIFKEYGDINFCSNNYPFVSFMTNLNNCSIFNNMTYHFNFTLPTKLNQSGFIEDYKLFTEKHKNAIHLIQWIEPILIAIYGTGDPLYEVNKSLTNTSSRVAKSRYIGLGTYDTDTMIPGKILHIESEKNHLSNLDYWWFNKYYKVCDYSKEQNIGVDINFHKHKNHGIEVRIFDHFNELKLNEILEFFVLILDHSLNKKIESPVKNEHWNNFVYNVMLDRNTKITDDIKLLYEDLFDLKTSYENIIDFYEKIYKKLLKKYEKTGECYQNMIKKKDNKYCYIC